MRPHARVWGDGAYLLIHCALAHAGVLSPLAERLPGGAVGFDLPGHGKSPPWDACQDYQAQAVAWAAAMRDAPGPVLGHSFGGTVALRFALDHPERVTRLVLVEPVYFAALRVHDAPAYAAYQARFQPILDAYEGGDFHQMAARFTAMWGGAPWATLPARFKDALARQMPLIIAQGQGIDADTGGVFAPGRLGALGCPVTLLRGSDSDASVAAIHAVLMRLIPGAVEHVIEGAGHMSPMTHTDELARLIQP
ncbi:MAG: alpha/beta hydrolase [Pseudomonadota bacterium]